jgi:hypothetical protein
MGLLIVANLLGSLLMTGTAGVLALGLYGFLSRHGRRSWRRCLAIAALVSGLFALHAGLSLSAARGTAGSSMAGSYQQMFQGFGSLGACGGFGLTAIAAGLMGTIERRSRRSSLPERLS